jgi:hypothetical protein
MELMKVTISEYLRNTGMKKLSHSAPSFQQIGIILSQHRNDLRGGRKKCNGMGSHLEVTRCFFLFLRVDIP